MIWAIIISRSCFCWLSPSLVAKNIINLFLVFNIWWCPYMYSLFLCCWRRVFAMTRVFFWQNSVSLFSASFWTLRSNLHVIPGISWLPTFALMKRTSLLGVSSKTLKDELPRSVGDQYATGKGWRNKTRKNEETESKQKQCPVVDVTGDGSKVRCCKEQYCIERGMLGSWIKVNYKSSGRRWQEWTSTFLESVN